MPDMTRFLGGTASSPDQVLEQRAQVHRLREKALEACACRPESAVLIPVARQPHEDDVRAPGPIPQVSRDLESGGTCGIHVHDDCIRLERTSRLERISTVIDSTPVESHRL
jgi:hypothetical protein